MNMHGAPAALLCKLCLSALHQAVPSESFCQAITGLYMAAGKNEPHLQTRCMHMPTAHSSHGHTHRCTQ